MGTGYLTLGAVAKHFGLPVWKIRRLFERHILPEPARAGPYRVVSRTDLPAIERALSQAGYFAETAS